MDDSALAAAERALRDWDVDVEALEPVSLTENIVFRVQASDGAHFVLRLHRPGYHTLDELVSEQMWTAALARDGVDVPVPTATRTDAGYTQVEVYGARRYAGMLQWVEGETMLSLIETNVDLTFTAGRYSQLGEIMASIHNHATEWVLPDGFTRHAFDADGLMGERPFWGRFWESPEASREQQQWLNAVRGRVHRALLDYGRGNDTYSLIHADLHPGNVVVNGERLHVIDFDDSGFGWHQYDLAIALFEYRDDPSLETIRNALYDGYRKHRALDERALSYVPLFFVIRAMAQVGWFAGRPEHEHLSYAPELIEYAMSHADEALAYCG